jgi:hypothetical protein
MVDVPALCKTARGGPTGMFVHVNQGDCTAVSNQAFGNRCTNTPCRAGNDSNSFPYSIHSILLRWEIESMSQSASKQTKVFFRQMNKIQAAKILK